MKYDFVEIGTSDFDTFIQKSNLNQTGISIEPIKFYLDRLPNHPKVHKINAAISLDNKIGMGQMYWLPESIIKEKNLPGWLRGCNSLGGYHYQHKKMGLEKYVNITPTPMIPLDFLFKGFGISELNLLKIDTEGNDYRILDNFVPYLKSVHYKHWPKEIIFESNELTNESDVNRTTKTYLDLGYKITEKNYENTFLKL